jgi:L,D-peptidoglycan transpeptidase YkuD (ErfK/YbiS/YcfS/YnhG family)
MRRLTAVAIGLLLLAPAKPLAAQADTTPPGPAWASCRTVLGGVSVKVRASERTRTIVDGIGARRALLSLWVRDDSPCGFVQVFSTTAWIGRNGFSNGKTRRQGSLTTPTGTYTMTEAFGINPNPGTLLPYHQVVAGDWWVQDNKSAYYNSLRNESDGGFRITPHGINRSERLTDYGKQYAHAVVINFNRAPDVQVAKRGSGIFLHANSGEGATAGCITIGKPKLRLLMSYLQPMDRVTIVR